MLAKKVLSAPKSTRRAPLFDEAPHLDSRPGVSGIIGRATAIETKIAPRLHIAQPRRHTRSHQEYCVGQKGEFIARHTLADARVDLPGQHGGSVQLAVISED